MATLIPQDSERGATEATPQRAPGDPASRPVVRPLIRPTARRSHVPPLGVYVTPDGGIDAAVLASHATAVDRCLIDVAEPALDEHDPNRYTERRVEMVGPVYGPWDPGAGLRHDPAKLRFCSS